MTGRAPARTRWSVVGLTLRVTAAALLFATGCGAANRASTNQREVSTALDGQPWKSALGHGHALVGRIWHRHRRTFVSPAWMLQHLSTAEVVLLGENHDNADHHRLQAWVLRLLVEAGGRPEVFFEMFDSDQAKALALALATEGVTPEQISAATQWAKSGWPAFALYRPIFDVTLRAGLRLRHGNLPRKTVRGVAMGRQLTSIERRQLGLMRAMPARLDKEMRDEVVRGHCYMLPAHAAGPMVLAQRARDGAMAHALLGSFTRNTPSLSPTVGTGPRAVLIAGNGHVRSDRGVPYVIGVMTALKEQRKRVVAVQFVEVPAEATHTNASDLANAMGGDLLVFTARKARPDPCERYKKVLERMRRKRILQGKQRSP